MPIFKPWLFLIIVFPNGWPDPLESCKAIKCIKVNAANTKGNTKCNAKNLFKVALFTLNPPQMNSTMSCPTQGIALIKLVITTSKRVRNCSAHLNQILLYSIALLSYAKKL